MELTGTIKKIGEMQTFASGFQKSELVLLTNEQYPQPINIEFLQDKCDLISYHKEGDKVKVHIGIRGREWTSPQGEVKYFNSIVGWRVEKVGDTSATAAEPTQAKPTEYQKPAENPFEGQEDEEDDLPF